MERTIFSLIQLEFAINKKSVKNLVLYNSENSPIIGGVELGYKLKHDQILTSKFHRIQKKMASHGMAKFETGK